MFPSEEALALAPFQRKGLDNLRAVMKRQGLTHAQLAERAGINRATVSGYLSGRRVGDSRYHAAIAEALGQDPGLFFPRTQCELDRARPCQREDCCWRDEPKGPSCWDVGACGCGVVSHSVHEGLLR